MDSLTKIRIGTQVFHALPLLRAEVIGPAIRYGRTRQAIKRAFAASPHINGAVRRGDYGFSNDAIAGKRSLPIVCLWDFLRHTALVRVYDLYDWKLQLLIHSRRYLRSSNRSMPSGAPQWT